MLLKDNNSVYLKLWFWIYDKVDMLQFFFGFHDLAQPVVTFCLPFWNKRSPFDKLPLTRHDYPHPKNFFSKHENYLDGSVIFASHFNQSRLLLDQKVVYSRSSIHLLFFKVGSVSLRKVVSDDGLDNSLLNFSYRSVITKRITPAIGRREFFQKSVRIVSLGVSVGRLLQQRCQSKCLQK